MSEDSKLFLKKDGDFKRIFAIPDTHGVDEKFNRAIDHLLKDLKFSFNDLLVLLGDYCDRNPGTIHIIKRIRELVSQFPDNVVALRGNHETFANSVLNKPSLLQLWLLNGGGEMMKGYGWNGKVEIHRIIGYGFSYINARADNIDGLMDTMASEAFVRDNEFLLSLPLALETGNFFFSHAPVPRENKRKGPKGNNQYGYKGQEYTEWELTWHHFGPDCERQGAYMFKHEGPRSEFGKGDKNLHGVCGHLHRIAEGNMDLREFPNYTLLDGGCGCHPDAPLILYECISKSSWKF